MQSNKMILNMVFMIALPAMSTAGGVKINICHVPPGNANNPLDLTISINGWDGHANQAAHTGNHANDQLFGCGDNGEQTENLYVVSNCKDDPLISSKNYRTQLFGDFKSYYDPVIVGGSVITANPNTSSSYPDFSVKNINWDAANEDILIAMSECIDPDKGNGYAVESDNREYWMVYGCKNKSAANQYKNTLKTVATAGYNSFTYHVIPESALNITALKTAYDSCLSGHSERLVFTHKGEDGFNFDVLVDCPNATTIDTELTAYWVASAADANAPIIMTESSLQDYDLTQLAANCCDASKGDAECVSESAEGFGGRLNFREVPGR